MIDPLLEPLKSAPNPRPPYQLGYFIRIVGTAADPGLPLELSSLSAPSSVILPILMDSTGFVICDKALYRIPITRRTQRTPYESAYTTIAHPYV
jgi:hypothetical protein